MFSYPKFYAEDGNGDPLRGGKLYSYKAGTSTAKVTHSDNALTTVNANPTILNARGEATVYLSGTYKFVLKDSDDNVLWTLDDIAGANEAYTTYYYPNADAADQGATGNSNTVKYAVDTISTDKGTIFLRHNSGSATTTYTFSTSETIPANIQLVFEKGAILSIDSGKTVTINGQLNAGYFNIFTGSGTVAFGRLVCKLYPEWWGDNTTPGTTDMTANVTAALAAALAATHLTVEVPHGSVYKISSGLTLDLGKVSLLSQGTRFNCASMTSGTAITVFSSAVGSTTDGYYQPTHKLSGIGFTGNSVAGVDGILVGHASHATNNELLIERCGFDEFDDNIKFMNNAWRIHFDGCYIYDPAGYHINFPSGLTNAGEVMRFTNCFIADGGASATGVLIDGTYQVEFIGCSILNIPLIVSGAGAQVNFIAGNIENPGGAEDYRYISATGNNASVTLIGSAITLNAPTSGTTDRALLYTEVNSNITLIGCYLPLNTYASYVRSEETDSVRALAAGAGRVITRGCTCPTTGFSSNTYIAISLLSSALYNGDFETGNENGWTTTDYGAGAASTTTVHGDYKKYGNYGLLVSCPATRGTNVKQEVPCTPGEIAIANCWYKVITGAASPVGYLTIAFYDTDGNAITPVRLANAGFAQTSWTWTSAEALVPQGAVTCRISINVAAHAGGGSVWVDDVILNFL